MQLVTQVTRSLTNEFRPLIGKACERLRFQRLEDVHRVVAGGANRHSPPDFVVAVDELGRWSEAIRQGTWDDDLLPPAGLTTTL